MSHAITATAVTQDFGNVHALRGVDLEIAAGTVYALLGHNGAGKTSLVNILTTLAPPASGHAAVAGFDVVRNPKQVRSKIGLTGQFAAVDADLTGRENIHMIGRLLGLSARQSRDGAAELLARFSLTEAGDRRAGTYSGGMRRRLDLAASLVGKPEVLFLDEPTTGLDPSARLELWEVIEHLVDGGATVLLTTQYLEEADRLAHRIGVMNEGLMVAEGTAAELKSKVGGHVVQVGFATDSEFSDALRALEREGLAADFPNRTINVPAHGASDVAPIVRLLDDAGIGISGLELREPTLDDVYFALTSAPSHLDQAR